MLFLILLKENLDFDLLIGVSLSEPHTSVTALQDACVCISVCMWPYNENLN